MSNKSTDGSTCTIVGIGMCTAGVGLATVMTGMFNFKEFVTVFFATIIAAGFGTGIAFYFQNQREDKLNRNSDIKCAHILEICLYGQYEILKKTYVHYLKAHKHDEFRSYDIPNPPEVDFDRYLINTDLLSIFTLTNHKSMMKSVMAVESNAEVCISNFNLRANYCRDVVSPKFNTLNLSDWVWSEEYVSKAYGTEIHAKLNRLTENVYYNFDRVLPKYFQIRCSVYEALSDMYPDEVFINPSDDIF